MTILVTGATGNVGRPLVARLLEAGHQVRALTRDPARAGLPAGAGVVRGDLTDSAALAAAFEGVTAAHLITFGGSDHAPLANGPDIVAAALRAGVRRVTVLQGGLSRSPLEEAVAGSELEWTFVGPVEFMSNVLEWAQSVREEGVVRDGFPEARSAMVHDADIAAVAAAVLACGGHGGQEYVVTGPEVFTTVDKVRVLGEALGREIRFVELSRDELVAGWRQEGYSDEDVEFFLTVRGDTPEVGYTVRPTVERVTGRPARTFRQWVAENAAAFGRAR